MIEDTKPVLSKKQRRRAEALRVAREVLTARTPITSSAVDSWRLIEVAHYINTGRTWTDEPPQAEA